MSQKNLASSFVFLLIAAFAFAVPARTEDGHTCPDYPQHDAVLKEGKERLKNFSFGSDSPMYSPMRDLGALSVPSSRLDLYMGTRFGNAFKVPTEKIPDASLLLEEIKSMRRKNTPEQMKQCYATFLRLAQMAILLGHPESRSQIGSSVLQTFDFREAVVQQLLRAALDAKGTVNEANDNKLWKQAKLTLEEIDAAHSTNELDSIALAALYDCYGNGAVAKKMFQHSYSRCNWSANQKNCFALAFLIAHAAKNQQWSEVKELRKDVFRHRDNIAGRAMCIAYTRAKRIDEGGLELNSGIADLISKSDSGKPKRLPRNTKTLEKIANGSLTLSNFIDDSLYADLAQQVCSGQTTMKFDQINSLLKTLPSLTGASRRNLLSLASLHLEAGNREVAKEIGDAMIERLERMPNGTIMGLRFSIGCFDDLIADLSKEPFLTDPSFSQICARAKKCSSDLEKRIASIECLSLANSLEHTGEQLLNARYWEGALKMFNSVVDIRQKNLPARDPLVASAILDKALVYSGMNDTKQAEASFAECLSIFRAEKSRCLPQLRKALGGYASFLFHNQRMSKFKEITKELSEANSEQ